jgi:hypothetical protein
VSAFHAARPNLFSRAFLFYVKEIEMPSKTPKQRRFMQAAAHNPTFAKQAGIPMKVAKEFAAADKKRKKGK